MDFNCLLLLQSYTPLPHHKNHKTIIIIDSSTLTTMQNMKKNFFLYIVRPRMTIQTQSSKYLLNCASIASQTKVRKKYREMSLFIYVGIVFTKKCLCRGLFGSQMQQNVKFIGTAFLCLLWMTVSELLSEDDKF